MKFKGRDNSKKKIVVSNKYTSEFNAIIQIQPLWKQRGQ